MSKEKLQIELSVQTDPELDAKANREHLNELIVGAITQEASGDATTVGLLITNDENVRKLNLQYRGQDRTTDVLAFASGESGDGFVSPPSTPPHLGDIVVSYPRAVAQAADHGHSTEEELDRLVVHGVLHLLGYDDRGREERAAMWERQEELLRQFRAQRR
jgi:probable rRNA maturation factor